MQSKTSIILLTCNRKALSKIAIDSLFERLINPQFIHLIVIDNNSFDGTVEMLKEYKDQGKISKLILLGDGETVNIATAYNMGIKYVESDWFITMQDDIRISKLNPDIVEQLISLMEKYPDHGAISARIQRIPNLEINDGNEDLIPCRKSISAYFRIQKKSDMLKLETCFGTKDWDDLAMKQQMDTIGKKASWCRNIWVDHMGHADNRGYPDGYERAWGWGNKKVDPRKPYPKINSETCEPLAGEKIYR